MKETTNYTVNQLVDKLKEIGDARYPNDPTIKWAYAVGTLQAILDWEVKGYNKGFKSLQETINDTYLRHEKELQEELQAA